MDGVILKALSGFYYVLTGEAGEPIACRARGKLRHQRMTPLVGDRVRITSLGDGSGMVDEIYPRTNEFYRPAVANIDQLIVVASGAIPVTDPFLIDRVASIAESRACQPVICINKCDLEPADSLYEIYHSAGFPTLRVSAETGEGVSELRELLIGKVSAFTGNSGVGKSSLLNALQPGIKLQVGEVSEKLGRGRHTTRHVELYPVGGGFLADTPGFSSVELEKFAVIRKEELAGCFREFQPYVDQCRFGDCSHTGEKGCAVVEAVQRGEIARSRFESYCTLYEDAKKLNDWELPGYRQKG